MNTTSSDTPRGPVEFEYLARLRDHEIEPDPAQSVAVGRLDRLAGKLSATSQSQTGIFDILRQKFDSTTPRLAATKGLYLYGGVGRGKTMLMDLFFEVAPCHQKHRSHFHEFMADAHDRIASARTYHPGDPIPQIAADIAKTTKLLCFDEMHVTDIADAMILSRLFKGLFASGVVVVATSNAHPDDLYKDGLNRQLFEPFIALIHSHMEIHQLVAAKDFRLDKLTGRKLYFTPANASAHHELDKHWHRLTGDHAAAPVDLEVKGRLVHIPLASMGVARFSFADLCAKPLGSLDYLRIAHEFHTVLIDDIPLLSPANRNEARRFINLIDTLYDCKVSLVASAAAEPDELYKSGDGADLFERTASRLMEMRTQAYVASKDQLHCAKIEMPRQQEADETNVLVERPDDNR